MLQTFLTGLREGLEAALVVSILITFLVRGGHRDRLPALWTGVGVAVVLSFGFGALLHFTSRHMSFEAQEAFGGILSIVAVGLRHLDGVLDASGRPHDQGRSARQDAARLELGGRPSARPRSSPWVVRASRRRCSSTRRSRPRAPAPGPPSAPLLGHRHRGAARLAACTEGAVHLDLAKFFRITGAALIVIAAGVLAYGIHDLQEAGDPPRHRQPRLGHRGLRGHQLVRRPAQGHLQLRPPDDRARGVGLRRLPRPDDGAVPATRRRPGRERPRRVADGHRRSRSTSR